MLTAFAACRPAAPPGIEAEAAAWDDVAEGKLSHSSAGSISD